MSKKKLSSQSTSYQKKLSELKMNWKMLKCGKQSFFLKFLMNELLYFYFTFIVMLQIRYDGKLNPISSVQFVFFMIKQICFHFSLEIPTILLHSLWTAATRCSVHSPLEILVESLILLGDLSKLVKSLPNHWSKWNEWGDFVSFWIEFKAINIY